MRFSASLIACVSALLFAGTATAARIWIPRSPDACRSIRGSGEPVWYLDLSTGGRVVIRLRPDAAPKMVDRVEGTAPASDFY